MRPVAFTLFFVVALAAGPAAAQETLRVDVGLTGEHFEQQVKTEVGGVKGEKLVVDSALGLHLFGTYRIWGPLSAGLFTQLDVGKRTSGQFAGFEDERTVVESKTGGNYLEFWVGPLLRAQWRTLFAEVGWGAFGVRDDDARRDLPDENGSTESALRTSPSIAWLAALGAGVPLGWDVQAVLRLEYRVRYYVARGDADLANDVVHGTQNLTPFVGVAWSPRFDQSSD